MDDILILLMTLGMLFYFFHTIWKGRKHLYKYISTVGERKPTTNRMKPEFWIPVLIIHGLLGIYVGYLVYHGETDKNVVLRLLLAFIVAFIFLLLLYVFYFVVTVIIKEIIFMKDRTINIILIYSFITCGILFYQLLSKNIRYPRGFLWISLVLYIVNIFSIGRIIWIIFKKKIHVKSIWSIAIMHIVFAITALSNIAFEIQKIYPTPCYSRTIASWGDALYFVVITFFTVGYGDLYPVCELTKILTMFVILSGFTFTAVFVSAALSATIEHFGSMEKK